MWKQVRQQEKALMGLMADAKKRAERKAQILAAQTVDPLLVLRVQGKSMRYIADVNQHNTVENGANLMPWNDDHQCLIDRFDGRALLDAMSVSPRGGLKIEENRDLEQSLNFERYRDIIEHKRELRSDSDVLQKVFHDIEEQDFKLYNKTAPTHRELEKQKARPKPQPAYQPGQGEFSNMGFKYDDDDEDDDEVKKPGPNRDREQRPKRDEHQTEDEPQLEPNNTSVNNREVNAPELMKEIPRDKERDVNSISRLYSIEDYARMVRAENNWLREQHENKNRRGRRLRDRIRENESNKNSENDKKRTNPPWRRGNESPTYDRYTPLWADDRSSSRSRSNSPSRENNIEFIDEIEVGSDAVPSSVGIDIDDLLTENAVSTKPHARSDDKPVVASTATVVTKKENPQEKLMRKMRHALDKTRRKDEEEMRRKEAEKEEERRQRELLLEREARDLEELQRTKEGEFIVERWSRSRGMQSRSKSRSRSRSRPHSRNRSPSPRRRRSRSRSRTRRHRSRSISRSRSPRSRRHSRSRSRSRSPSRSHRRRSRSRSRSRNRKRKSRSRSGSRDRKRQRRSPSPTKPPAAPVKKMTKLDRLLFEAQEKEKKLLEDKKATLEKARHQNKPLY